MLSLPLLNMLSYTFIMSITPGPNNVICLTQGTKFGFKASLPFMYGIVVGCLSQQWLILFLGSFIGDVMPMATTIISYLGAVYMIYLAIKILRSTSGTKDATESNRPMGIKAGTFFQYANPKAYIFNTTIISSFILPMNLSLTQNFMLSTMTGCIFLLSTGSWVLFGQAFTKIFSKYHKPVSYTLGATLVYLVVSIVLH